MENKIIGSVHHTSQVRSGKSYDGERVVEVRFISGNHSSPIVIDRATASRLIRQLQRVLDDSYNEMINQRPERDASKDYSSGY